MTLNRMIDRAVADGTPPMLAYTVRGLALMRGIDLDANCEVRIDAKNGTVSLRIPGFVDCTTSFEEIEAYFNDEGPTGPAPEVPGECPAGAPCLPGE